MRIATMPAKWGLALLIAIAALVAATVLGPPARAASGYWRYVRTEVNPTPEYLASVKPLPGRTFEQRATAAFQAKYAGQGSIELLYKNDDADLKVFTTRLTFTFGTTTDMSTLTPGAVIHFRSSTTIESNFPGASAWNRMAVDNADYFLQVTVPAGSSGAAEGEFRVPGGGPGGELRVYGAAYLSANGAMGVTVTNVYAWVEGPPPPTSGSSGQPGQPAPTGGGSSGAFGGGWSTSEGPMSLNQSGAHVTGTYGGDNGRVDGQVQGNRFTGYWGEDGSAQQCGTQRLGTYFWGRVEWVLAADGRSFEGRWSYCDAEPGSAWTGQRTGPAPSPTHNDGLPAPTGGGERGATTSGWGQAPSGGGAIGHTDRPAPTPVPAHDALGSRLDVVEGDWIGIWIRRPGTNIFDATWRNRTTGGEARDTLHIESLSGSLVVLKRDGNNGRYFGSIGCDGRTITGSASWYPAGMIWTATIAGGGVSTGGYQSGAAGGHAAPSGGVSAKVFDNWNTGGCSFTDMATLDVGSPFHLDRMELWINWQANEQSVSYRVERNGQDIGGGVLHREGCDPYQASWCIAADTPQADLQPGRYVIRIGHRALCQNSGSGGAGFIRAWGRAI
jgi:hypothetical protein